MLFKVVTALAVLWLGMESASATAGPQDDPPTRPSCSSYGTALGVRMLLSAEYSVEKPDVTGAASAAVIDLCFTPSLSEGSDSSTLSNVKDFINPARLF